MKRFVATVALLSAALGCAREPDAVIEWPYVGSDQAQTKYSAAEEITAANVGELEIVLAMGTDGRLPWRSTARGRAGSRRRPS